MPAVTDFRGAVIFQCVACGIPLTEQDFYDLGMRLPDHGETRDDYCDAELLDDVSHASCLRARAAV